MGSLSPLEEKVLNQDISALAKKQDIDGRFKGEEPIILTALVLVSLISLKETPVLKRIKKKAAQFLLTQKAALFASQDLYLIFSSLNALFLYDHSLLNGKTLAKAVALLTQAEIDEGGPYRRHPTNLKETPDLETNAAIAYFLSLQEISLPKLTAFLKKEIKVSPGTNFWSAAYWLSRCPSGYKKEIKNKLLSQEDSLNQILRLLILLRLGEKLEEKGAHFLLQSKKISSVLEMAFRLEVLTEYLNSVKTANESDPSERQALYQEIVSRIKKRFILLPPDLKKESLYWLNYLIQKDKDQQRALMPYFFKLALGQKGERGENEFLIKLGVANLYGWLAYTIYDNFLDEEGQPPSLPVANLALRELTQIFQNLIPQTNFASFFNQIMDCLEGANAWETGHSRLEIKARKLFFSQKRLPSWGNYEKLAERSLGHALGPTAILFSLGYKANSAEVKNLITFFKHFIIAKQLNDDIYDWEKDCRLGQATAVVTLILQKMKLKPEENLSQLIPKMRKVFGEKVIDIVGEEILVQVKQARRSLKNLTILQNKEMLAALLTPLEEAAKKTLEEKQKATSFLKFIGQEASLRTE